MSLQNSHVSTQSHIWFHLTTTPHSESIDLSKSLAAWANFLSSLCGFAKNQYSIWYLIPNELIRALETQYKNYTSFIVAVSVVLIKNRYFMWYLTPNFLVEGWSLWKLDLHHYSLLQFVSISQIKSLNQTQNKFECNFNKLIESCSYPPLSNSHGDCVRQ